MYNAVGTTFSMFQPILAIFKELNIIEVEVSKVYVYNYESDVYINLEYELKGRNALLKR
jgi:hypothetical protein